MQLCLAQESEGVFVRLMNIRVDSASIDRWERGVSKIAEAVGWGNSIPPHTGLTASTWRRVYFPMLENVGGAHLEFYLSSTFFL